MTATVEGTADSAVSREWPAWQVPATAVGEWLALQVAIDRAAWLPCHVEPALWWSSRATPSDAAGQDLAAAACTWCPVLDACRAYAVAAGERDGVWGGTTPAERRSIASGDD